MQSDVDRERIEALGASPDKVQGSAISNTDVLSGLQPLESTCTHCLTPSQADLIAAATPARVSKTPPNEEEQVVAALDLRQSHPK